MTMNSVQRKAALTLAFLAILLVGCKAPKSENVANHIEEEIEGTIVNRYDSLLSNDYDTLTVHFTEIFQRLEFYYLATGYLKSISKTDYADFMQRVYSESVPLSGDDIHRVIPKAGYIYSPSNFGAQYLSFRTIAEESDTELSDEQKLAPIVIAIEKHYYNGMQGEEVPEIDLVKEYLNSMGDARFESHFIYRAWLISVAYAELVNPKSQRLRNRANNKN